MNISFTFKNFEPSEHLKDYASQRFEKLVKYLGDKADESPELQVNLAVEKHRHMAEVIFISDYLHLSAYEESTDMYSTIDMVLDKLEAQVKKIREKIKEKRRAAQQVSQAVKMDVISYSEGEGGERERSIVETNNYEPKPMDVDEAAMQLESKGFDFLVFRNAETNRINVIYLRKDGDFGLIDPGI